MLNLDAAENDYLFGEHFEEQLSKIICAKQTMRSTFTGLQKKPNIMNQFANPINQVFPSGKQLFSKSVSPAESGNNQSTKLSSHKSSDKKVVINRKYIEFLTSRVSSVFPENLGC